MRAAAALAVALAAAGCNDMCDGPACAAETEPCPTGAGAHARLEYRWSIATDEEANPEIVSFVPGAPGRAIVTSTDANRLSAIEADEDQLVFVESAHIETGSTSGLTSVTVSPSGDLAAITITDYADPECTPGDDTPCEGGQCVAGADGVGRCSCHPGAPPGCACGAVLFADLHPGSVGTVLGRIGVGYAPDGGAFSPDGRYFITADEDDLDDRPCKPPERLGGSVSIIELGAPQTCETPAVDLGAAGSACRVQQIAVDSEQGDEPEETAISPLGVAVVAVQDSDKLGFFQLDQIPSATLELVPIGDGTESSEVYGPDGMAISPDGGAVVVSLEDADAYLVVDVATHEILDLHPIGDDVPTEYHRDERDARHQLEPEQVTAITSQGATFVIGSLQEAGASVSYRLEPDGHLTFDSIQPVGIGWAAEREHEGAGTIGPEGISAAAFGASGRHLILTANEREGSLTLLRSTCPRD